MFKKYLTGVAFSLLALSSVCQAETKEITNKTSSIINVVNENKKPLKIIIEAVGDSNAVTKMEISAEHKSSFEISSAQLNGKTHFHIKGDTSAFTPGGKCENLKLGTKYQVTFTDDKMGTSCIAEAVPEVAG